MSHHDDTAYSELGRCLQPEDIQNVLTVLSAANLRIVDASERDRMLVKDATVDLLSGRKRDFARRGPWANPVDAAVLEAVDRLLDAVGAVEYDVAMVNLFLRAHERRRARA